MWIATRTEICQCRVTRVFRLEQRPYMRTATTKRAAWQQREGQLLSLV